MPTIRQKIAPATSLQSLPNRGIIIAVSYTHLDITKHTNFKYTADADEKNAFDIEAFLSTRLKLKPNEVYDVYEVDAEGA